MNISRKEYTILLCAVLALPVFLAASFVTVDCCLAHGNPGYQPPPPPPPPEPPPPPPDAQGGSSGGQGNGPSTPGGSGSGGPPKPPGACTGPASPGPNGPSTPGPTGPLSGTRGPAGAGRGAGAFTRKSRNATAPSNSWEFWWARNRYEYMDFPKNEFELRGPLTPTTDPDYSGSAAMDRLRNRSIEVFRLFLDDKSARMRKSALICLGRLNDVQSLPRIIDKMKDGNQAVRSSAVLALGLAQDGKARYTLLNMARDTKYASKLVGKDSTSPYLRGTAGVLLALTESEGIGPVRAVLQQTAADKTCNDEVRAMALEGLGLLGDEESVQFLSEFSQKSRTDYRLVSAAVTALCKSDDPTVLPLLLKHLSSRKAAVRQSAAVGLGLIGRKKDRIKVIRSLYRCFSQSSDPSLKGFSLISIGQIGGPDAIEKLRLVLKRGTSADLPWACLGLGLALSKSIDKEIPEDLITKLRECRNRSTKGAAAIALGLAGCKEAVNDLLGLLKDGDEPYLRGYCAMALGMIGEKRALPLLRKAVMEINLPQVNTQAAMALGLMQDRDSVPRLKELLLASRSEASKAMAARSLALLAGYETAASLLDFIKTTPSDDVTYRYTMDLISRLIMEQKIPFCDRVASYSNYTCEFPIVTFLLDFGV